jgi:hypothetical protein
MAIKNDPEIKSFFIKFEFWALEILKEMERLRGSSKKFKEESGQC